MAGSNWTGRTPRNLNSAFGPYCGNTVHPMPETETRTERMAGVLFAVTLGICGAALLVHWICK